MYRYKKTIIKKNIHYETINLHFIRVFFSQGIRVDRLDLQSAAKNFLNFSFAH